MAAGIRVLGPLEAEIEGVRADLGGPLQRAVLALLLMERGRVVSVDRMIDQLWRGEPPPRAIASLQAYVSNLRRILEPGRARRAPARILISAPPGYALRLPDDAVDAWRFGSLLTAARQAAPGQPERARRDLGQALALWRGPAYAEFADEEWAAAEVARLTEQHLAALARRSPARLPLAGLPAPDAAALVSSVYGGPVDDGIVQALGARTGGNPFYLIESAKLLASEGALVAVSEVPEGVRDVLSRYRPGRGRLLHPGRRTGGPLLRLRRGGLAAGTGARRLRPDSWLGERAGRTASRPARNAAPAWPPNSARSGTSTACRSTNGTPSTSPGPRRPSSAGPRSCGVAWTPDGDWPGSTGWPNHRPSSSARTPCWRTSKAVSTWPVATTRRPPRRCGAAGRCTPTASTGWRG
ncbi:MAG TPA: BTAD domain-containing putative transcriptional regulator [Streptosporangiaceae bacterium]|nr:BTAD domain-containing putative transcriptional regulator [Streptosporangiaceae bacterium]